MIRTNTIISVLSEQAKLNPKAATYIAKAIYNSKGYVWDDERGAIKILKKYIKNIQHYNDVTKELQKLTSGKGLGQYLHSFMSNQDLAKVASYLIQVLPSSQWHWTVKQIYTWQDVIEGFSLSRKGAGGIIPDASRRPSPAATIRDRLNFFETNPNLAKKDLLYIMIMNPNLYKSQATTLLRDFEKFETHQGLFNASSLAYFVPVVGPFLAAGILTYDAKLYIDEGNPQAASLSIIFASLPFIGKIVRQIPVVARFEQKALLKLSQKVSKFKSFVKTGSFKSITEKELATLSADERALIQQLQQHEKLVYDASKTSIKTWKEVLKNPKFRSWKDSLPPNEWKEIHRRIMSGELTISQINKLASSTSFEKFLKRQPELEKWFRSLSTRTQKMYRSQIDNGQKTLQNLANEWRVTTKIPRSESYALEASLNPSSTTLGGIFSSPVTLKLTNNIKEEIATGVANSLGVSIEKSLGSGAQGYAFKTTNGGVIKITQNPTEVAAAYKLSKRTMGKQHLAVSTIKPIRINGQTTNWYVLSMDFITVLTDSQKGWWSQFGGQFLNPSMTNKQFLQIINTKIQSKAISPESLKFWQNLLNQRKTILRDVNRMKIWTPEMHSGNVGFTKYGKFTTYDYWVPSGNLGNLSNPITMQRKLYQKSRPISIQVSPDNIKKLAKIIFQGTTS